jgi:hypothetical protein
MATGSAQNRAVEAFARTGSPASLLRGRLRAVVELILKITATRDLRLSANRLHI